MKAHTILVNGVSKTYAMTGWRIGFAAADPKIIKVMTNYLSHCISGTSAICQAAAVEAFPGSQAEIETMRATFEERRNYLYERMNKIPGVHGVRSEATFYLMMSMEELVGKTLYGVEIHDADDFSDVFLEKAAWPWCPAPALAPPTSPAGPSPCPWRPSKRAWTGWKNSWPGQVSAEPPSDPIQPPRRPRACAAVFPFPPKTDCGSHLPVVY